MTFLTILGVTEIYVVSDQFQKGKQVKRQIKIRVLRKFFRKQFSFIWCRKQHLRVVEQRRCSRFTFLRTLSGIGQKSHEPGFLKVMDSCFISTKKFVSYKNPIAKITSISERYFRIRSFILLVEKVISHCNWTRTQNPLVRKQILNFLAIWLIVGLGTNWFWVPVQLQSFKCQISGLFLDIQATIECGFTLKRVRDMTRTDTQLKKVISFNYGSSTSS